MIDMFTHIDNAPCCVNLNVDLILSFLEKLFGINVRVFGHKEKFSERSLIILNHRCHFDWLFFWMVVGKRGDTSSWLVMLKRIGKVAPFFGGYIFPIGVYYRYIFPIGVYYRYINSHVYYVIAFFI